MAPKRPNSVDPVDKINNALDNIVKKVIDEFVPKLTSYLWLTYGRPGAQGNVHHMPDYRHGGYYDCQQNVLRRGADRLSQEVHAATLDYRLIIDKTMETLKRKSNHPDVLLNVESNQLAVKFIGRVTAILCAGFNHAYDNTSSTPAIEEMLAQLIHFKSKVHEIVSTYNRYTLTPDIFNFVKEMREQVDHVATEFNSRIESVHLPKVRREIGTLAKRYDIQLNTLASTLDLTLIKENSPELKPKGLIVRFFNEVVDKLSPMSDSDLGEEDFDAKLTIVNALHAEYIKRIEQSVITKYTKDESE